MDDKLFQGNIINFKKCMNTLFENDGLLSKRNYNISDFEMPTNIDEIIDKCFYKLIFRNNLEENKFIVILFTNTINITSKNFKFIDIENFLTNLHNTINESFDTNYEQKELNINLFIIVTKVIKVNIQIITRKLLNKIKLYTEFNNINVESFIYKELLFNITKHVLIPNNIKILSESEKKSLKLKYNLSNYLNIPHINTLDPLSKFYGLVCGNIIRIVKNSSNAGFYITYRIAK